MKKFFKWVGILLGLAVLIMALLGWLGYSMMQNGTEYLEAQGFENVQYLGNADEYIYCKGQGTGMAFMVTGPDGDKRIPTAVCVSAFGNVTDGK